MDRNRFLVGVVGGVVEGEGTVNCSGGRRGEASPSDRPNPRELNGVDSERKKLAPNMKGEPNGEGGAKRARFLGDVGVARLSVSMETSELSPDE